jgi:hypothetical protein
VCRSLAVGVGQGLGCRSSVEVGGVEVGGVEVVWGRRCNTCIPQVKSSHT